VGVFSLVNATVLYDGYDFSGDSNKLTIAAKVDELDSTTFTAAGAPSYHARIGGLRDVELALDGYWQSAAANAVDPQVFPVLGAVDKPVTVSPDGAAGSVAYLAQMGKFAYDLGGSVGDIMPFTVDSMGTNGVGLVRGQVAAAKQSVSATGALGSAVQLGAPTATQYVYATFHVLSAGTTITIQVQSDTASNFPSPTTQATIGPLTAQGGTWMTRVIGPFVGETWWRFNVSALTGTFQVAGAIGVQ